MLPGGRACWRHWVVEAAVRRVEVAVDERADDGAGLFQGFELLAPDAAELQLGEPGFDERLAFRVAVAAAAVGDVMLGEPGAERAAGVGGSVVSAECQRPGRSVA